ncbi:MAG: DHA2 family efflux MFS transporter permease subunit, partial [Chloroflexota bacterium]
MNLGRARWLSLLALSLGISMIIVDATIVNVAIPSIVRDLGLDGAGAEWIVSIYPLVFAALLITLGRIGDVFGRRRLYLFGLVTFTIASLLAGLAPTGPLLVAARILQGVGGAAIAPATQSILNFTFRGRDRAIAFAVYGSVIGGMAALGPLLGGWLTTNLSWRWAFLVNLPIGLVALVATLIWVKESRDEHARRGFDLAGFATLTFGLVAVVFGLIEGYGYGWWAPSRAFTIGGWTWPLEQVSIIPFAFGLGFLSLIAFALVEIRRSRAGAFILFDFTLWTIPSFRFGNLTATIVSLGEFGLLFALPLFLQGVLGYSAFDTGLVFLALAVGSFVAAPIAGGLAHTYEPRRVVQIGMALETVGVLATALLLGPTATGVVLAIPLFVYGLGVGFATAQLANVVLGDVAPERSGLASAANSTMRQIGTAVGAALIGTVLLVGLNTGTRDGLATVPGLPSAAAGQVATAIEASNGQALVAMRDDPRASAVVPVIEQAFTDAARTAGLVAATFIFAGLLFSLR